MIITTMIGFEMDYGPVLGLRSGTSPPTPSSRTQFHIHIFMRVVAGAGQDCSFCMVDVLLLMHIYPLYLRDYHCYTFSVMAYDSHRLS